MDTIYTAKFGSGNDVRSLGWGGVRSQETRFHVLLEIQGFQPSDTVLDVGCGYGDLSKLIANYTGIDIRDRAIQEAERRYPTTRFAVQSIDDIAGRFDWVVASGIFAFDSQSWVDATVDTVSAMFRICTKGVAFNVLSDYTPNQKDPDMKYVSPSEIIDIVSKITRRFTLRHDYLANDMTVYLYK